MSVVYNLDNRILIRTYHVLKRNGCSFETVSSGTEGSYIRGVFMCLWLVEMVEIWHEII